MSKRSRRCFLLLTLLTTAQLGAQVEPVLLQAEAWLAGQQNLNGSFGAVVALAPRDAAAAVVALERRPVVGQAVTRETYVVDLFDVLLDDETGSTVGFALLDDQGFWTNLNDDWCPRTPGFWKNHPKSPDFWKNTPEEWPVTSLDLGGVTYEMVELEAFLDYGGNDAATILAHHPVASKLKLASGADASIQPVAAEADSFLSDFPPESKPKG